MKFPALRASLAGALLLLAGPAMAQSPAPAAPVRTPPQVWRDARYCELLPLSVSLSGLKAQVFNTIGYGDCPAAQWKGIEEMSLRKQFGALTVILNGPRHFLMDRIIPKGATAQGEVITLNGITFESRAEVSLSLFELLDRPFSEHTIDRETVYVFDAGKPTFRLTTPAGAVYVMQSYAQFVDPSLTYETLPALASKLKLPEGWTYSVVTPTEELLLKAEGKAIVVQDNLKNTYQKMVP